MNQNFQLGPLVQILMLMYGSDVYVCDVCPQNNGSMIGLCDFKEKCDMR